MTITELIPSVKSLSHTDKLRLLQMLVEELVQSEVVDELPQTAEIHNDPAEISTTETMEDDLTLETRLTFLKKPLAERRRIMAAQADAMQTHYEQNSDWRELMTGDIIEY